MIVSLTITEATYEYDPDDSSERVGIIAVINGQKWSVPLSEDNDHYNEIMRQVAAGDLTIGEPE